MIDKPTAKADPANFGRIQARLTRCARDIATIIELCERDTGCPITSISIDRLDISTSSVNKLTTIPIVRLQTTINSKSCIPIVRLQTTINSKSC